MENDIKKDVMISVAGKSDNLGGDDSPAAFVTEGRLYRKGKHYYVNYKASDIEKFGLVTIKFKLI